MAVLAEQVLSDGGAYTTQAAAAGDQIGQGTRGGGWDFGVALIVENSDVASRDVTVAGMDPVTVPASGGRAIIPVFGIYTGHARDITYSAVAGVSVAAVRIAGGA